MSEHKERPIVFSRPMVRAILAGAKTQTRRVVRGEFQQYAEGWSLNGKPPRTLREDWCPLGQPNDRLWVRETWRPVDAAPKDPRQTFYQADVDVDVLEATRGSVKWRSPYMLPRRRARLVLIIEDIRVERLQAITIEDAKAEAPPPSDRGDDYRGSFRKLWNQINGRRLFATWEQDPLVYAITFTRWVTDRPTAERSRG